MSRVKRYWILMPPFCIVGLITIIFTGKFTLAFIIILLFHLFYSLWNYYADKKNKDNSFK